jgi:hypothetical protein
MTKLTKVEVLMPAPPERRRLGRPKKILDLGKLDKIKVAVPESAEDAIATLLVFDARCLDMETRQELLRVTPQLVHVRRAWRAEYMECGCLSCHKKKEWYGAGGLCAACHSRIGQRMRNRYRKLMAGRDLPAELATFTEALSLKFNVAQRLLNGDD